MFHSPCWMFITVFTSELDERNDCKIQIFIQDYLNVVCLAPSKFSVKSVIQSNAVNFDKSNALN